MQGLNLEPKDENPDIDLSVALDGLRLAPGAEPTRAFMEAVEAWCGVEDDADVAVALVADLKDDLCEESLAQIDLDSDDDHTNYLAGEKDQSTQPVPSPRRHRTLT